jgi:hypothetical protein
MQVHWERHSQQERLTQMAISQNTTSTRTLTSLRLSNRPWISEGHTISTVIKLNLLPNLIADFYSIFTPVDYTPVGSNFTPEVATETYPNFVIPSSTPTPAPPTYATYEPTIPEQTQYYALASPQQDVSYTQQYVAVNGTAPFQYPSMYNALSLAPHATQTYHYPVQSQSQQSLLSYAIASAQLPPTSTLNSPLPIINSPAHTLQHTYVPSQPQQTYVPSQPQRSHSYPAQRIIHLCSPSPIPSTSSRAPPSYEVARTPTPQLVDSRPHQAPANDNNEGYRQRQRGAPSYSWQMPSPPPSRQVYVSPRQSYISPPPPRHSHVSPPPSTVPDETIAIPLSLPMGGPGYQVAYIRSGTASTAATTATAAAATTSAQTTIEPAPQIDLVDPDSPDAILGNVEPAVTTTAPNVIDARRLGLACLFCRGRKIACGPPPHPGTDSCKYILLSYSLSLFSLI